MLTHLSTRRTSEIVAREYRHPNRCGILLATSITDDPSVVYIDDPAWAKASIRKLSETIELSRFMATLTVTRAVADRCGRAIEVRQLDILERLHLMCLLGPARLGDRDFMMRAVIAAAVVRVDGQAYDRPKTFEEIELREQLLGVEGQWALQRMAS